MDYSFSNWDNLNRSQGVYPSKAKDQIRKIKLVGHITDSIHIFPDSSKDDLTNSFTFSFFEGVHILGSQNHPTLSEVQF